MRNKRSKIDSAIAEAKSLVKKNPERASKLADWAFKESQTAQHLKGQGDALAIFASLFFESDPCRSHDFASKAAEVYHQLGDRSSEADVKIVIAAYFEKSGWLSRSHYILLEALELGQNSGNSKVCAAALFNLGSNAEGRGDFESALDYFSCAKITAEESNFEHTYLRSLSAEQEMHYQIKNGKFDIAEVQRVLSLLTEQGMEKTRIEIEVFLSKVARDNFDYWAARSGLRRAYSCAKSVDDKESMAEIVCLMGESQLERGKVRTAQKLLTSSLNLAREVRIKPAEMSSLKLLAKAKAKLGDSDEALRYMTDYSDIQDELHAHESKMHFQEMKTTRDIHVLLEESMALKKTNLELAAVNDRLEATLQEKRTLQKELERLATVDELTGALNRREIMSCGAEIITRFYTQSRPSVVMIVDIDHFKLINDGFGHSIGDEVLRRFSKSCRKVLRPTDRFGRLGGEEFCILLDRTSLEIALKVAERVMVSIRSCRVADLLGDRHVTASIGVVEVNRKHSTIESALHDADLAMYEAKRTGRDKICVTGVKKKKAA
ncbi:MAG: GGDEF domain-containing protein [Armatimonadota bacterium]